jgi:AraC-like DNA-binding protein
MNAPADTPPASLREAAAWTGIDGTWRPLYGSFVGQGVSIEWHEFSNAEEIDWSQSFHPESLEVCLNFSGRGSLDGGGKEGPHRLGPEQIALTTTGVGHRIGAGRAPGHLHRFVTVELSASFLRAQLDPGLDRGTLLPEVDRFLDNPSQARPAVRTAPMVPALLSHRLHLVDPPVGPTARPLWYESKVAEIVSHLLFRPAEELFCHRQRRVNRERCERVLFLLERDLENPPALEMLAKEVGCSPFYLSRLFAQETGSSIPKYLRQKRLEKAVEYLRSGRMNVSEAADAVGYASLSAFNKAFVDQFGCRPGAYPRLSPT